MQQVDSVERAQMPVLSEYDPDVAAMIRREVDRQRHGIELIASENFVSEAVLEAMGTPLTNKYAEGLPGKRYYGGCEFVDQVEQLAIDRAKKLFGADHANVQAHSGQCRGLPRVSQAGRQGARPRFIAGWTPDARFAGQLLGTALQRHSLRRERRRPHRLRCDDGDRAA
jgi:hypothetical protein